MPFSTHTELGVNRRPKFNVDPILRPYTGLGSESSHIPFSFIPFLYRDWSAHTGLGVNHCAELQFDAIFRAQCAHWA